MGGIRFVRKDKYDICGMANGVLAGLVAITAPCDGVYAWSAALIGFIGALCFLGASKIMRILRIDDPLDAFAVHGCCGAWGVMSVAFFNSESGVFYGGEGKIIGVQLLGVVTIGAWSAGLSSICFGLLRVAKMLRVSEELELKGLDAACYPAQIYNGRSESDVDRLKSPETVIEKGQGEEMNI